MMPVTSSRLMGIGKECAWGRWKSLVRIGRILGGLLWTQRLNHNRQDFDDLDDDAAVNHPVWHGGMIAGGAP